MSTLCNPIDCSLPGSSFREILQARILEWVAISSSSRYSPGREGAHVFCVSCIFWWILNHHATWEAPPFFLIGNVIYIFFIWLLRDLVEVCGILLLVRGWNPGPLHWEHRVLTNGPPGKF